jgi:hypothetical protein
LTAIETGVPAFSIARDLVDRLHNILRSRDADALAPSVVDSTLLGAFTKGIKAEGRR